MLMFRSVNEWERKWANKGQQRTAEANALLSGMAILIFHIWGSSRAPPLAQHTHRAQTSAR